ncbi:hypothetical protein SAMN05444481_11364 [Flavobacterium frigidimaris]|jgi:hypothetical protein|nr:hypothetical protein SAMN05444481_11364 [Flavobacterium frigidimaris]
MPCKQWNVYICYDKVIITNYNKNGNENGNWSFFDKNGNENGNDFDLKSSSK